MTKLSLLLFLLASLLISCVNNSFTSLDEYKSWVVSDDSGYLQRNETENLQLELVHFPFNLDTSTTNNNESANLVFQFRVVSKVGEEILNIDINSPEAYKERIDVLEYGMQSLFWAVAEDTLQPSFVHYENYRGLKNEILVHVHFSLQKELQKDFHVFYQDNLFHSGTHEFAFSQELIKHPPQLKLKTS